MRTFVVAVAWLAAVAGAVALVFAGSAGTSLTGSGFSLPYAGLTLAVVANASVGAVLSLRRQGNIVGRLLMLAAILMPVTFVGFTFGAVLAEERGRHDILAGLVALIFALGIIPTYVVAGPLVALFFPSGRLPGSRWRWPVGAGVAAIAVGSATVVVRPGPIGGSFADNPFGVSGLSGSDALWEMGLTLAVAAVPFFLVLALAAVIVRFRRAGGVERAQLKWFVAANVAVGAFLTLSLAGVARPSPTIFDVLASCSLSLPPIAVGVAILRYRLYDIDRLISRGVSWAILSGLLVAIYAGAVLLLEGVLGGATQGDTVAVAGSTLLAAALFQPLRRSVQSVVDRRFNRARYDAERTAAAFTERLRDQVDLASLSGDIAGVVGTALGPSRIDIWLRAPRRDGSRPTTS
jgi:hypothetical protein